MCLRELKVLIVLKQSSMRQPEHKVKMDLKSRGEERTNLLTPPDLFFSFKAFLLLRAIALFHLFSLLEELSVQTARIWRTNRQTSDMQVSS